jgi:hypothetical protein
MKEGSVVMVLGNLDQRIREVKEGLVLGTAVLLTADQSWVLLSDGNMWIGPKKLLRVFDPAEQSLR